jgi:3-hydroxyacyl-[acyl-carrier-protein] dehydratase
MPGVLIVEAMAQAAAVLSFKTMGGKPDATTVYYFAGIDGARFRRPVGPGDQLILDVSLGVRKRGIWKYSATATVDGNPAAEAELICTLRTVE